MNCPIRVLGRRLDPPDLLRLQAWIDQQAGWSRRRLSAALAEFWDWRNPYAQLREIESALTVMTEVQGEFGYAANRRVPNESIESVVS